MSVKNSWYHTNWQNARLNFILSKYPKEFFNGKRILELGACNAYFSATFKSFGAEVLAVEGRQDNIQKIKEYYPDVNVTQANLDTDEWNCGRWDIILNFGLYYHLEKYHDVHLKNCLDNCELMFFESVIYDSHKPEIYFRDEQGYDQSLSDRGGSPTTSFVEDIFKNKNKTFEIFRTSQLNGDGHFYDWVDTGNDIFHQNQRRFWIVK
jgi:hypothetical protein